jgi:toxin ParE1/3/4
VVDAPQTLVEWSLEARADLAEIHKFVARDSHYYAELLIDQLLTAVDRLQRFRLSGRVVPELQRDDFREVLHGNYRIVYRLTSRAVTILTLFHAARLLPADLERRKG